MKDLQRGQVNRFLCSQLSIHSRWKTWLHLCIWLTKCSLVNSVKQTEQISSSDPTPRCSSSNLQTRSFTSHGIVVSIGHVRPDRMSNMLAMAAFSWLKGIHTQVKKTTVAMDIEPLHNAIPIIILPKTQDQQPPSSISFFCWFLKNGRSKGIFIVETWLTIFRWVDFRPWLLEEYNQSRIFDS